MTKAKTTPAPSVSNMGAHIENVHIECKAASVSNKAAEALGLAARAALANAEAIGKIADAIKGAEARMGNGIHFNDLYGSKGA